MAAVVASAACLHYFGAPLAAMLDAALVDAQRAHIGLPVTVLIFCATAFLGAPQAVLIAACVFAFGAVDGFWYAWIATLASGALTFRAPKNVRTASCTGALAARFQSLVTRNGFLASLLMRFLPGPPFIMVNMALAAAGARFWPFLAGLAIGVVPKTALIAFAGGSLGKAFDGQIVTAVALIGAIVLCVAVIVTARRFLKDAAVRS